MLLRPLQFSFWILSHVLFYLNGLRDDDTAIIAKRQEELIDIGRKCGMEINIEKSQVITVSKSNESLHIKVGNRN
jgi:hypothetical protein